MKKAIIAIALIATGFFAQAQKKDSVVVSDSIPLLSIKQVNEVFDKLQNVMKLNQSDLYKYFIQLFQEQIDKSIADLKKKKQK